LYTDCQNGEFSGRNCTKQLVMTEPLTLFPKLILYATVIFGFSSCYVPSVLQTAKVVEKNHIDFGLAYSKIIFVPESLKNSYLSANRVTNIFRQQNFTQTFRYGLGGNFDFGFTTYSSTILDLKYQFIGDRESKLAASGSIGLLSTSSESIFTTNIFSKDHTKIPLHLMTSYHPNKNFAIYSQFRLQNSWAENAHIIYPGVTVGLSFKDKKSRYHLEYTYDQECLVHQLNLGVVLNFDVKELLARVNSKKKKDLEIGG